MTQAVSVLRRFVQWAGVALLVELAVCAAVVLASSLLLWKVPPSRPFAGTAIALVVLMLARVWRWLPAYRERRAYYIGVLADQRLAGVELMWTDEALLGIITEERHEAEQRATAVHRRPLGRGAPVGAAASQPPRPCASQPMRPGAPRPGGSQALLPVCGARRPRGARQPWPSQRSRPMPHPVPRRLLQSQGEVEGPCEEMQPATVRQPLESRPHLAASLRSRRNSSQHPAPAAASSPDCSVAVREKAVASGGGWSSRIRVVACSTTGPRAPLATFGPRPVPPPTPSVPRAAAPSDLASPHSALMSSRRMPASAPPPSPSSVCSSPS